MTDMTLEQVIGAMTRILESTGNVGIRVDRAKISKWRDAIDAHLAKAAQPVEAVDVRQLAVARYTAGEEQRAFVAGYEAALAHPRPTSGSGSYADDETFPSNDRDMLLYLMRAFDSESFQCQGCGRDEDTASMDSAIALREYLRAHAAPTGEQAGEVVDWTDNDVETLRNLRDAVGKYANLKKLWVPTIDKMLARARHVDNPAFMPYAKPRPVGVPDPHTKDHYEQDEDEQIDTYSVGHMDGWNSCREAMLAAAPARGKGGEA